MTLQELCMRLGRSEKTMTNSYQRTIKTLAKRGIIVSKTGRGPTANYEIDYVPVFKEQQEE